MGAVSTRSEYLFFAANSLIGRVFFIWHNLREVKICLRQLVFAVDGEALL